MGVSLVAEQGQIFGVGLALDSEEVYFIPVEGLLTENYLCGKLQQLLQKSSHGALTICSMDVKSMLKYVDGEDFGEIFDTGVAAYLLNPLKNDYTYEDVAREQLGLMTRSDKGSSEWTKSCYEAYTAYAASEKLMENSKRSRWTGCFWKLRCRLFLPYLIWNRLGCALRLRS